MALPEPRSRRRIDLPLPSSGTAVSRSCSLKLADQGQEVPKRPTQAIELGDGYDIYFALAAIGQEPVKCGAAIPGPRHAVVDVLRSDSQAASRSVGAKCMKLRFNVLLGSGDAGVEGNSGHRVFLSCDIV